MEEEMTLLSDQHYIKKIAEVQDQLVRLTRQRYELERERLGAFLTEYQEPPSPWIAAKDAEPGEYVDKLRDVMRLTSSRSWEVYDHENDSWDAEVVAPDHRVLPIPPDPEGSP
jgi:hypothetical protein